MKIQHSRSTVVGQGVLESDTKNHRTRIVVMPQIVFDDLGELFTEQALENNGADWNGFSEEYHLHTMRHTNASLLISQGVDVHINGTYRRENVLPTAKRRNLCKMYRFRR